MQAYAKSPFQAGWPFPDVGGVTRYLYYQSKPSQQHSIQGFRLVIDQNIEKIKRRYLRGLTARVF
jgi:hypothetical protein